MRIAILSMALKMGEGEVFWLVGFCLGFLGGFVCVFLGWSVWVFFLSWIPAEMIGIFLKKIVFFSMISLFIFFPLVTNCSGKTK